MSEEIKQPINEPQAIAGKPERFSPEKEKRGRHFDVSEGVMNILQSTDMISSKNNIDIPDEIARDLPAKKKNEPQPIVFIPKSGFHYGDGTPIAFDKSQIIDFIGLCKAIDKYLKNGAYRDSLPSNIYNPGHKFLDEENKIRMKLTTFSRLSRGDKRGGQTNIKNSVHKNLLLFANMYGRFIKEIIDSNNLIERNEQLIRYDFEEKVKFNKKTKQYTRTITYIDITFHDVFLYMGRGFTQFPDNFADLVYAYGKESNIFTYLLLDIIKQRGLHLDDVRNKQKAIEDSKGTKKEKGIAKSVKWNEAKVYKHTKKYLLDEVLGNDKSRYEGRTTDWRTDLREAIQSFVKMGLVEDVAKYGDGHGTYIDSNGGLGCDLRINLNW